MQPRGPGTAVNKLIKLFEREREALCVLEMESEAWLRIVGRVDFPEKVSVAARC